MRALLFVALALCAGPSFAVDQFRTAGAYTIHWNALPSDFIAPDIATKWGITRSLSRALVNVTLTKAGADGMPEMQPAKVSGTVRNLLGQEQVIDFNEKRDGREIYYLGQFRIAGEDTYRIELSVTPPGAARAETIVFTQPLVGE